MIRTSRHTTKFSNTQKKDNLKLFISEYRRVAELLIDHIWSNGYAWTHKDETHRFDIKENQLFLPSMLTSTLIKEADIDTFLTGRAIKCCLTQVASMINSEVKKQKKRLFMLDKLKSEGQQRSKRQQLIKKIKQNIPVRPDHTKMNPELNSICCNFQDIESNEFDGFLRLTSITKTKTDIRVPVKHTRHSRRLMKKGKLMTSFLVRDDSIDFRWDIPDVKKRTEGKTVGADQGMLDVLTLSDTQVTPKQDCHGHSLSSIIKKLSQKKKGSRAFGKAQDHRENFIHWSIKQLNLTGIRQINLERIWNIGHKSRTSRNLSHWTNTLIRDKVESIAEELGVQVTHQSSTYRSQRCSDCGVVRKSNRKGKTFECHECGLIIDSDYNASLNHEQSLPEIPWNFRELNLNRKGFFWKKSGLFDLEGRSLQSLLHVKT